MAKVIEVRSFPDDQIVQRIPSSKHEFGTQLIVRESQQALFLNKGKLLLCLDPGTYTIDNAIIPGIDEFLPGGVDSLQCDIWFLNKTVKTDLRWGTGAPVEYLDPEFGIMVPVGAYGTFESYIEDFEKFFRVCIGTKTSFSCLELEKYFRPFIQREVKTLIANECTSKGVYNLSLSLTDLSQKAFNLFEAESVKFGVGVRGFFVQNLSVIGDDPSFQQVKTALAKAAATKIENQSITTSIDGYKARRTFDVLDAAANSIGNGGGGLGSEIASVGLGAGAGLQFGTMIGQLAGSQLNSGSENKNESHTDQKVEKLMQLKKLHEAGVLDDNEFAAQKSKLLENF